MANLIDRAIAYFNPAKALERGVARAKMDMLGGVGGGGHKNGARDNRGLRLWRTSETSANEANSGDLKKLRARSRDLARNEPIAVGAIATAVTNVVGDGLVLKPQVDAEVLGLSPEEAEAWQKAAAREFDAWARRPDFTDRLNFDEMQALAFRSVLESGDLLVVRRRRKDPGDIYGLKLQFIEAERISNPNNRFNTETMVDGVQLDGDGRPVGYSICSAYPGDFTAKRSWKVYSKGTSVTGTPLMLHLYQMKRVDEARGVPWLSPVVGTIKQMGDYTDAEIRAAVISAMFTVFVKPESLEGAGDPSMIGSNDAGSGVDAQSEIRMESGAIIDLRPGEDVSFADPKRPNSALQPFIEALAKQIGVALELPFEVLMKSFTASYSASRAALEMAWQFFRMRRSWLAWKFCQPVYEWVIVEAIVAGRLSAPGFFDDAIIRNAWLGSDWIGPSRIQLDPQKEAAADLIDLGMGTKTRDQIITERTGGTFEAKHAQLAKEEALRKAAGLVTPANAGQAMQGQQQQAQDNAADKPQGAPQDGEMRTAVLAMLAREPQASVVNVAPAAITVEAPSITVQPAAITVEAAQTTLHVPEIKVPEIRIPDVVARVEMPPPVAAAPAKPKKTETTVIEHDARGRIKKFRQEEIE